ncbi:hypothetical protein LZF95_26995, partial [Algoriphagus sp. AGSA1]|nr:hypothetical protein [Algoriphagus sp. AGSA1]
MNALLTHFPILPVVIPLVVGGLLIVIKDTHRHFRLALSFASIALQLAVAIQLLFITSGYQP